MEKRTLFRIAIAIKRDGGQDYSATKFARDNGVSTTVLWGVLSGADTSAPLEAKIDAFIEKQLAKLSEELDRPQVRA